MATKAQIKEDRKVKAVTFLKKTGPSLPKALVAHLAAPIDEVKVIVDELIDEGKIRSNADNKKLLETVPAKKKADAPAPAKKAKAKPAPEPEEEDDDEDEEEIDEEEDEDPDEEEDTDDWGDEEDEEEVEEETEDDEEADDPEEEDEVDDDEDDDPPAPVKKGKGAAKAAPAPAAPHKVFTLPFKPIDTLTDKELTQRINDGVEAAESAHGDGFVEVAEMLMRSVARARKQLNKRK